MQSITEADIQACKELVDWWDTGLLDQNGELRRQAAASEHFPDDVRRAEDELCRRLVRAVAGGFVERLQNENEDLLAGIQAAYPVVEGHRDTMDKLDFVPELAKARDEAAKWLLKADQVLSNSAAPSED